MTSSESVRPFCQWYFVIYQAMAILAGKAVTDFPLFLSLQDQDLTLKYLGGGMGRKNKTAPGEMSLAVSNLD